MVKFVTFLPALVEKIHVADTSRVTNKKYLALHLLNFQILLVRNHIVWLFCNPKRQQRTQRPVSGAPLFTDFRFELPNDFRYRCWTAATEKGNKIGENGISFHESWKIPSKRTFLKSYKKWSSSNIFCTQYWTTDVARLRLPWCPDDIRLGI